MFVLDVYIGLVSKQALIMQLQKVLILHIKRFEFNSTSVIKNNDFLSFELLLDMAPYCTNGCLQVQQVFSFLLCAFSTCRN